MIRSRVLPFALVLLVAVAACGDDDDDGTGPAPADPIDALVGSYTTQSFRYTAEADPTLTVDLAGLGAGINTMILNSDATFSGTATLEIEGEFQTLPLTGTLTGVTTSALTINFDPPASLVLPNPLPVTYTLSGTILSFTATGVNFDFSVVGGPAGETPSILEVVLLQN